MPPPRRWLEGSREFTLGLRVRRGAAVGGRWRGGLWCAARVPHASQLSINSGWLCLTVGLLAVLAVTTVPWRWESWRHRRLGRTVTVLVAVSAVVLACSAEINRLGSFYPTLGTLIGTSSDPAGGSDLEAGADGDQLAAARAFRVARSRGGHGTTEHLRLSGRVSGLVRDVDVYLPPGYDDPNQAVRFPVVEWFPGFPGEPREVTALFGLPGLVDQAIARAQMPARGGDRARHQRRTPPDPRRGMRGRGQRGR